MKTPDKREIMERLLREQRSVFIHLTPRQHGDRRIIPAKDQVVVPPWLHHQAQLVLQVGYDMPIPIPDLRVDEAGVLATLSFARNPFKCWIPWSSVFALVGDDGRGMDWLESMPVEILAQIKNGQTLESAGILAISPTKPTRKVKTRGSKLVSRSTMDKQPQKVVAMGSTTKVPFMRLINGGKS